MMKPFTRRLLVQDERGILPVQQIVAIMVILAAAAGLGIVFKSAGAFHQKAELTTHFIEIENAIFAWSTSESEVRAALAQGNNQFVPDLYPIKMDGKIVARVNQKVMLNARLDSCADAPETCFASVEVQVRCRPVDGRPKCNLAYRLTAMQSISAGFGVSHSKEFQDEDFIYPLTYEGSQRLQSTGCDPSTDLFAGGLDRDSGRVRCVRKPTQTCRPGEFAIGLRYDPIYQSMEPQCLATHTLDCPSNYALEDLSLAGLDARATKSGTCVLVTQPRVAWRANPVPATSVSGKFCPQNFVTSASCELVEVTQSSASCSYTCNCTTLADGSTSCEDCNCTVSPVAGTVIKTDGTREASWRVEIPTQPSCPCGAQASWTAKARLTGICNLDSAVLPERRPL